MRQEFSTIAWTVAVAFVGAMALNLALAGLPTPGAREIMHVSPKSCHACFWTPEHDEHLLAWCPMRNSNPVIIGAK